MERVAIVGSGLAALAAYATLRHGGIAAEEITVFGTHNDPTEVWRARAEGIRQRRMRSESDGHLGAASWPGLALRERRPRAVWQTTTSRYHPPVALFLRHAGEVRARSGWDRSFHAKRIERISTVDGGFAVNGGEFRHVLVATGHPALERPDEYKGAVHAYEPHEYASKVVIVGAGMAAATEWLNALAAGSEVVSIRRREPLRRPLNVPRQYFSRRGLGPYQALPRERRAAFLRELSTPSYPPGPAWDGPLQQAEADGRLTIARKLSQPDVQVICATGFKRGFAHDPLLSRLVDEHGLETHDQWILLDDDSTVPALTDDTRTLAIAGVAGQWTFPAADTIAGAKYAARAFLCRTR